MNETVYQEVISGARAYVPLEGRVLWQVCGEDRARYLNGQVTQDVRNLSSGDVVYAAVCTAKGRMEGDLFIAASDECFFLDADESVRESLGARLEKYIIADDVAFEDVSDEWSVTHVFGDEKPEVGAGGYVFCNPRFGFPGYDIWLPGRDYFEEGCQVEKDVLECLRLEQGLAKWGVDMDTKTLPPEAGLADRAISYTKGCYVGQETISRIKSIGHVNRSLQVMVADGESAPAPKSELWVDGQDKPVGLVTSSGYSLHRKKGIALGYVQRQHAEIGTKLRAGDRTVTLIQPPLTPIPFA